jgi:hypothetical protein
MHKQALIYATRMNQLIMDTHLRAQVELEMLKNNQALPNMVIGLSSLFSPYVDGINTNLYGKVKSSISTNLSNNVS